MSLCFIGCFGTVERGERIIICWCSTGIRRRRRCTGATRTIVVASGPATEAAKPGSRRWRSAVVVVVVCRIGRERTSVARDEAVER